MLLLFIVATGCRCDKKENAPAAPPSPRPRLPRLTPAAVAKQVDPLATDWINALEKLDFDGLLQRLDLRASLHLEAYRKLALAEGTWRPSRGDLELFEEYRPLTTADLVQPIRDLLAGKNEQARLHKRRRLMARVLRTLITKGGPPKRCRHTLGRAIPADTLLSRAQWSVPARRLGARLTAPWSHAVRVDIRCTRSQWRLLLLQRAHTNGWVVAEPAPDTFARHWWLYKRLPDRDPFVTHFPAPTKPSLAAASSGATQSAVAGRKTVAELARKVVACLGQQDARCVARNIAIRALATRELLEAPTAASTQSTRQLRRLALDRANPIALILPSVKVNLWRRLLLWTQALGLQWKDCRIEATGKDEARYTEKRIRASWKRQTLTIPKHADWYFARMTGLRSVVCSCPDRFRLTLTAGRFKPRSRWHLLDLVLERWPASGEPPLSSPKAPTPPTRGKSTPPARKKPAAPTRKKSAPPTRKKPTPSGRAGSKN